MLKFTNDKLKRNWLKFFVKLKNYIFIQNSILMLNKKKIFIFLKLFLILFFIIQLNILSAYKEKEDILYSETSSSILNIKKNKHKKLEEVCLPECSPECKKSCNVNPINSIIGIWSDDETGGLTKLHFCKKNKKLLCGTIAGRIERPINYQDIILEKEPLEKPKDLLNPDPLKRSNNITSLLFLENLSWDNEKKIWVNGVVYNPLSGKSYGSSLKLINSFKVELWGHLLCCPILGKKISWTRLELINGKYISRESKMNTKLENKLLKLSEKTK